MPATPRPVLLLHGGLWEDMDAARFWQHPGITDGLAAHGLTVLAPDRLRRPPSWPAEVEHLVPGLPASPVVVVGGSNGCSTAARLAVDHPDRVARLVLAWPATAGDPMIDPRISADLAGRDATRSMIAALLDGGVLRGVSDAELVGLRLPVGVLPSAQENPFHQRRTVDALLRLIPGAVELPGSPEPPRPTFAAYRDAVVTALSRFAGLP
jgi:pimeloyl-ACP methyl ester carboxylesterase